MKMGYSNPRLFTVLYKNIDIFTIFARFFDGLSAPVGERFLACLQIVYFLN